MDGYLALLQWLSLAERELILFAGAFFLLGAFDELAMDAAWGWLRLTGRIARTRINRQQLSRQPLRGPAAVLIPAWQEEQVIAATITHALAAWPQDGLRLYVGCYRNDAATIEAIVRGAGHDPRLRLVIHDRAGPTTKADCLNRLYAALEADERRTVQPCRMVLMQDAEDMVDPAALALLDQAMDDAEFVQLPVLPAAQPGSRWVGSHYCEEFAEAHGKGMVVRDALGTGLPAAGVGCAFARPLLKEIARLRGQDGPFCVESLTEDYELGLGIAAAGGRSRFLRVRGEDGQLVATRACFPDNLEAAVRQKARWVHGIALQGWDRLGWTGNVLECWMRLRDRRGPINALVLFTGYALLVLSGLLALAHELGAHRVWIDDPLVRVLLLANFASFAWRALMRLAFTTREYGLAEGCRAVLRVPVANIIAIMAGRRAMVAYVRTLAGAAPQWDKTAHHAHPPAMLPGQLAGRPA
ncbi:MAG: glycosyl transferase family protein [Croceibacterium sp.]